LSPEQLYEYLLNTLQPEYEKKFGIKRSKNVMNISSLVSGKASYLYHWNSYRENPITEFNLALIEGSSFHAEINQRLEDLNRHELSWTLPFEWKNQPFKDITIVGHYDNILPVSESVLCEWKLTGQQKPSENGLLLRAKRQIATYASILKLKTGVVYECFAVIASKDVPAYKDDSGKILRPRVPGKLHIFKLSPEEVRDGYDFVRLTAYAVAREFDK